MTNDHTYRPFLLEALSGLILAFSVLVSFVVLVAKLHLPFLHLIEGSGQAVQYQPEGNSEARLHPLHNSTIGWQTPPLKEQPVLVINTHSNPCFTVVQSIGITPFLCRVISGDLVDPKKLGFYQPVVDLSTKF